jgi:hypothetical protein
MQCSHSIVSLPLEGLEAALGPYLLVSRAWGCEVLFSFVEVGAEVFAFFFSFCNSDS